MPTGCSATTTRPLSACREAIELARAIDDPYSLAMALAYAAITHQMRHDLPELQDAVAELRELCDRYGFAYYREWALILDGWSGTGPAGLDLARPGINNLKSQGAFARMPYWLSLLADLCARDHQPGAARADPRRRARRRARPRRRVVAARGDADARRATTTSRPPSRGCAPRRSWPPAHGSIALLRRCERDLAAEAFAAALGVLPTD